MIVRKLDTYIADHYARSEKALLLTGARLAIQNVKDGKLNSYSSPQALYEKLGI